MPMMEGSDQEPSNGRYRNTVYDAKDTATMQMLSVREYCLTLRALRSEDWETLAGIDDRLRALEGKKPRR